MNENNRHYEHNSGDLNYFEKYITCQGCKEKKKRLHFKTYKHEAETCDGKQKTICLSLCTKCRSRAENPGRIGNREHLKWKEEREEVSRPSMIDLMESYRQVIV